ncbi:MAG: hypothetical protein HQL84_11175 [Magnetococcales bacterium]|nr:hypothetical protein [Magnetococcales bacterium]MBF0632343.1 hypothetical protein [Magnetococcales bacterium]
MIDLYEFFQIFVFIAAVIVSGATVIGATKSGAFKSVRQGNIQLEKVSDKKGFGEFENKINFSKDNEGMLKEDLSFETEQLARYYSQVLAQSKISFWFSLVFASLGFTVIIMAAFMYKEGSFTSTSIQAFAGVVMDSVSALFFIQSKNAQKSMGEFFDKLRNDRLHLESRKLCDNITNQIGRDGVKMHLALHYAGLPEAITTAQKILEHCLEKDTKKI